jgi:proteasome component ECM29
MLKISKNAGPLLKPHIPVLVTALLEAVSGLEPQVLNYFSLQVSSSQRDLGTILLSVELPKIQIYKYAI